jgi:hypothetical protein
MREIARARKEPRQYRKIFGYRKPRTALGKIVAFAARAPKAKTKQDTVISKRRQNFWGERAHFWGETTKTKNPCNRGRRTGWKVSENIFLPKRIFICNFAYY